MAEVIFTAEDERIIEDLVAELDPVKHPFTAPLADLLPSSEWARWVEELRGYVRTMARACLACNAAGKAIKNPRPDIWYAAGMEVMNEISVSEDIIGRRDLPMTPDGEWSLPSGYVIAVGEEIPRRLLDFSHA